MAHFLSFVAFATAIAVAPSPNTFLTLRNTVIGGRARGLWTTLGIGVAGATQGVLAAAGLGAIIARSEPVLQTIRWLGVAYLVYLGVMALRTAIKARGEGWAMTPEATPRSRYGRRHARFRGGLWLPRADLRSFSCRMIHRRCASRAGYG